MFKEFSASAAFMGVLAAFTGFAGSFAIILQGLSGVGASDAQAASGLLVLSVAMGVCGILLSIHSRVPVSVAWSTPGAALLATTAPIEGGFSSAVGAFLICGAAIILAGAIRPLGRAVEAIPASLANAMLAGILFGLCLAPFKAVAFDPVLGLPILLAWVIAGAWRRMLAVPAALVAFICVVLVGLPAPPDGYQFLSVNTFPQLELVDPVFSFEAAINIALPLFIVTMASQNIPGIAVIASYGFRVRPTRWFVATGLFSFASAPFGGHAINLAAITAAMCAGEEANEQPSRRYWAAVVAGACYVAFGLLAGVITGFVSMAPDVLISSVAGLALIGAFGSSAKAALNEDGNREAAAVTFLVTASGITLFGVSGAFWGLLAGAGIMVAKHVFQPKK